MFVLVRSPCARAQGVLDALRDDVRTPSASASPNVDDETAPPPHGYDDGWDDCDEDGDRALGELLGAAAMVAVTSPYWVPRYWVGDDSFAPGFFARYPYRNDLDGLLAIDPWELESERSWLVDEHYAWLLRVRGEYTNNLDSLSSIGGHVLLDSASRWGLDSEFQYRRERLTLDRYDSLWTGDCNVVYRFAQSRRVQLRSGIGFNWLSDTAGSDFGFNFTYGGDWFPRQPWIVSAELDWGTLGRATLFHGRATLGIHVRRFEIYTGYDYYDVGNTQIGGLVSGVSIWY